MGTISVITHTQKRARQGEDAKEKQNKRKSSRKRVTGGYEELNVKRLVTTCYSFLFIVLFVHGTGRNRCNTLLLHGCCRLEATGRRVVEAGLQVE